MVEERYGVCLDPSSGVLHYTFALYDTISSWNHWRDDIYCWYSFHIVQVVVPTRKETPRNATTLSHSIRYCTTWPHSLMEAIKSNRSRKAEQLANILHKISTSLISLKIRLFYLSSAPEVIIELFPHLTIPATTLFRCAWINIARGLHLGQLLLWPHHPRLG